MDDLFSDVGNKDDPHVGGVGEHIVYDLIHPRLFDAKFKAGPFHLLQQADKSIYRKGVPLGGDAQAYRWLHIGACIDTFDMLLLLQKRPCIAQKLFPLRRELDPTIAPAEDGDGKFLFQFFNRAADAGLRYK